MLVAAALVCTLALLFGIPGPLHRHSAADLIALRDRINEVCGTTHGPARIDWVAGRVNYPNGTPQLTDDENQMLGSGPKIGCVSEAIR